jgi:hypothetical protein
MCAVTRLSMIEAMNVFRPKEEIRPLHGVSRSDNPRKPRCTAPAV